jgi:uncharacterized membrane protein
MFFTHSFLNVEQSKTAHIILLGVCILGLVIRFYPYNKEN